MPVRVNGVLTAPPWMLTAHCPPMLLPRASNCSALHCDPCLLTPALCAACMPMTAFPGTAPDPAGHSVMHAVKALGQRTAARPGSAWRVGVMPHMQSHAEEKEAAKREAERLAAQEAGVVVSEGDVEGAAGIAQRHPTVGYKTGPSTAVNFPS